jgi:serine/threonine protein kinase/tetratricopeptide (TPR) repeat protein
MAFESGVRIGRYEIGRKLGQGGFGILYAARDTELGRDIAIKFLRPEHALRPQVVQRFLQEARATARISHPGIVTVHESGEVTGTNTRADGTVYIAMELLSGNTLAHRLKQSGTMPYRMALGYCRQLASALGAAHAAGIVHRDLKPQNVFLVADPALLGGERLKVLDFGIAKLIDDMGSAINTQSMLMLGTPMYMSPEQCRSSARADARSDIYSLGCILFEMVCGKTPFEGDSGELIAKHQLVPPPSARDVNPALPIVLDQLINSMLAKNPDERPPTMASVLDVLEDCEERSVEPPTRPDHSPLPEDSIEPPSSATLSDEQVAKAERVRQRGARMPLAIGAAAAVAIGIGVGFYSAHDGDNPQSSAASNTKAASNAAAVETEKDLKLVCLEAQLEKRWADLHSCGEKLVTLGSSDGGKFVVLAEAESDNEAALTRLQDAIRDKDMAAAKTALDEIEAESVFYALAQSLYAGVQQPNAPPVVVAKPKVESKCNADRFRDDGLAFMRAGKHVEALGAFEASLECQQDQFVEKLTFVAACSAKHETKARAHYAKLTPAQRAQSVGVCTRNKISFAKQPAPEVAKTAPHAPASCDPDALKEEGMQNINLGQHAAALAKFEASLRCQRDPYVTQLAFMESCASANSSKAKQYYKLLTAAQQAKFAQMCVRMKIDYQ